MDILLERWEKHRVSVELWRIGNVWEVRRAAFAVRFAVRCETYQRAREELERHIHGAQRVFDLSTAKKHIEFQIFRNGRYVRVTAAELLQWKTSSTARIRS